jgi:hypothetical protein
MQRIRNKKHIIKNFELMDEYKEHTLNFFKYKKKIYYLISKYNKNLKYNPIKNTLIFDNKKKNAAYY